MLTRDAGLIFRLSGEAARRADLLFGIQTSEVQPKALAAGINGASFEESIDLLEEQGYIRTAGVFTGGAIQPHYQITPWGFERYLHMTVPEYPHMTAMVKQLLIQQVQGGGQVNTAILVSGLGLERLIVNHILDRLITTGAIKAISLSRGDHHVLSVSTGLRLQYRQENDSNT